MYMSSLERDLLRDQLKALEERVAAIEEQQERFVSFVTAADSQSKYLSHLMLIFKASREQETNLHNLMEEIDKQVREGTAPHYHEVEKRVYEILPAAVDNYWFVAAIIRSFAHEGKYLNVWDHYKADLNRLREKDDNEEGK